MRQSIELDITNPNDFWHVTYADGFVVEDPDIADGVTRTYLEGDADWETIATVMTSISRQLKAATSDCVSVTVDATISEADLEVIRSWFRDGDVVIGDPGYLENGRRRLWKTLRARPHVVVPVRSEVRAQAALDAGPSSRQVDNILHFADDSIWTLNQHLRAWFENHRSE